MKTVKISLLCIVLTLLSVMGYSQVFPIISSVLPNQTKNLVSSGLLDADQLTIRNTGVVTLRVCMNGTATGNCSGAPSQISIMAGATVTVTVAQLGGNAAGQYLNVSNPSLVLSGALEVDKTLTTGGCVPSGVWVPGCQTDPNSSDVTQYIKTGVNVGIGLPANQIPYDRLVVNGNGRFTNILTGNFSIGEQNSNLQFNYSGVNALKINSSGLVGIGTTGDLSPNYKLSVNGSIRAKNLVVETGWSDFVFESDYKLISLSELEKFIKINKHLPEIPSAKQIEADGAEVNELLKRQMQKIEELTLYIIEQNKQIIDQNKKIEVLQKKVSVIENK